MARLDHRSLGGALPALLLVLVAACGQAGPAPEAFRCDWSEVRGGEATGNLADPDLAGVWLTAPGSDDVTTTLNEDGTFTWENRSLDACATGPWTTDTSHVNLTQLRGGPRPREGPGRRVDGPASSAR